MEITIVGSGTGIPSPHKNPPCIFMKLSGKNVIFDSGPGSLKTLLQLGIDYRTLDFIFYTHLHLDHVSEFAAILFATKIPPVVRKRPLGVYGPTGLNEYYKKLKDLYEETIFTDAYKLDIKEIENTKIDLEGHEISTKTLEHHGGGMGYRILTPEGRVVVYSGDTGYCDQAIELAKDADLLILECSSPDEMAMKGHLTPTTAGKIAQRSNAKKLVFVHMYPVCEQYDLIGPCKKEFGGKVLLGRDMMRFKLN